MVYGSDKRLPYDLIVQLHKRVYNCDAKVQFNTLQVIHATVRERLQAFLAEIRKQHNRATLVSISIDGSVVNRAPDRQSKLIPTLSGLFLVTEKNSWQ